MQAPELQTIYLPDTMANWPWPRAINPHYEEISAESTAWIRSFKAFDENSQKAFEKGDFGLVASLANPFSNKEHLRTACDLMNVFFVIDEYTDVEEVAGVREIVDIVIDALNNPHKNRPEGEINVGEITRQFWARAVKTATPSAVRHMVESMTAYLNSVVEQAADRDNNRFRTVEEYFKNRRENIGLRPSLVLLQLGMNLSDEVWYHPVIVELSYYIADLVLLDNDLVSYNKEQATGDDRHNILTIVMHQYKIDLEGAIQWVAEYHKEIEKRFLDGLKKVPSWGVEIDKQVEAFLYGLGNWPRCNDCWNFECGRYFGNKGREIQKSRIVPLLPKKVLDPCLRRENVVIPMIEL